MKWQQKTLTSLLLHKVLKHYLWLLLDHLRLLLVIAPMPLQLCPVSIHLLMFLLQTALLLLLLTFSFSLPWLSAERLIQWGIFVTLVPHLGSVLLASLKCLCRPPTDSPGCLGGCRPPNFPSWGGQATRWSASASFAYSETSYYS